MYDKSDPRAALAATTPTATEFSAAEYARFYDSPPQESSPLFKRWYARGQNFIVSYIEAAEGAEFCRSAQPDEYVVLVPDASTEIEIQAAADSGVSIKGGAIAFVPPGESVVRVAKAGRIVMMHTSKSLDLAQKCSNAEAYEKVHPNIPEFEPWPVPATGLKLRHYSLDVPDEPGRFGKIWRCTTFMINFLPVQVGPRDVTKLSPHHHDTFEQGSLALSGSFTHHIRWPWTSNLNVWRSDDHELCGSPSLAVIPPPAIHTSRAMEAGVNQLVDIFSPPRMDFSQKLGWVLNADDYPMPS